MNIDLLTIKLVILIFSGMIGVITFQFCIYNKKDLNAPEFILYSIIFSLFSYLFQFKKLLMFLNDNKVINLDLNFLIIGIFTSFGLALTLAKLSNKGILYRILRLNHSGKSPLIEDIYLKESKYKSFIRYYANVRTEKFLYTGCIETIHSKGSIVELLISDVSVYEINQLNETNHFEDFASVFLALEETKFSIEFLNNP